MECFKVILVEDQEPWLDILSERICRALDGVEHELKVAKTYEEAVKALNKEGPWHLLVTDICLTWDNQKLGMALIDRVSRSDVPAIALSAVVTQREAFELGQKKNVCYFDTKNDLLFNENRFVEAIKRIWQEAANKTKNGQKTARNDVSDSMRTQISISLMYILHLSDLHFGTTANANNWYGTLADDLKEFNHQLDALILSGDIANKSTEEEYNAAERFVTRLCGEFHIKRSHIIIVPGNHDLNWELGDTAYQQENGNFKVNQALHQKRFDNFRKFYEAIKGEPYPLEYEHQGIVYHLSTQKLLVLGLNSAWKLDRFQKIDASINSEALTNALNKVRDHEEFYKDCLKIAVWHHPLNSSGQDRIKDHGFMERLAQAGFRFALHGHIHKAESSLYSYDHTSNSTGRKLNIICAGTFGAPVSDWVPGYPLQYNLLKLEGDKLTVETRCREKLNGAWKQDARWSQGAGKDNLPRYEIQL